MSEEAKPLIFHTYPQLAVCALIGTPIAVTILVAINASKVLKWWIAALLAVVVITAYVLAGFTRLARAESTGMFVYLAFVVALFFLNYVIESAALKSGRGTMPAGWGGALGATAAGAAVYLGLHATFGV